MITQQCLRFLCIPTWAMWLTMATCIDAMCRYNIEVKSHKPQERAKGTFNNCVVCTPFSLSIVMFCIPTLLQSTHNI